MSRSNLQPFALLGAAGVATLLAITSASATDAPTAETLLRDADRARGGAATGITWHATVEVDEDGGRSTRSFRVKARENDALVEALSPPRHQGEVFLFNDRAIWFVKPGLRRPVSISARQKLSGDASNGDISSTNYARDYAGLVAAEEDVDGEPAYRLELKARTKNVTYDQIRYWIGKRRHLGLKAEFLTVAGTVFKTAEFEYGNTLRSAAGELPFVSRMTIKDATGTGTVTRILFDAPRAEVHPVTMFNVNNVLR